jgi:hypothetical protein
VGAWACREGYGDLGEEPARPWAREERGREIVQREARQGVCGEGFAARGAMVRLICRASKELTREEMRSAERQRQKRQGLRTMDWMHTIMRYRS